LNGRPLRDQVLTVGRSLYRDLSDSPATTFLLSSGRSGSTWLGAMLHSLPATRMIFEPFHARRGIPSLADYRYSYLPPASSNTGVEADLRAMLARSTWNAWVEQFNPLNRLVYRRRLVKEVRINLLLPWLLEVFGDCRFVLLLRHPAAVVLSQVTGGWMLSPDRLLQQPGLQDLAWPQALRDLDISDDPFEQNLVFWAIENRVALDAARQADIPILFYEELCMQPEMQISRLESYLGADIPAAALEGSSRASWSSSEDVSGYSLEQKIAAWQSRISPSQLTVMLRVLEAAGLDSVYNDDLLPVAAEMSGGKA
jgi:hypothetical protein